MLDEDAWREAALLTGFSQYSPVDGRAADNQTDILVFYSATAIYFGVKAHAAPGAVHATLANRDKIDSDDSIQIFLNPFNDGRQALVFGVNPFGSRPTARWSKAAAIAAARSSARSRAAARSPT